MADPLSIAAGIVGLLAFAGSTLTKGYSILSSLQGSKSDIQRLLSELSQLTGVLVAIEAQEKEAKTKAVSPGLVVPGSMVISNAINSLVLECRQVLKRTASILDKLDKNRKAVAAVKWLLMEPEVKKLVEEIARNRDMFILCLGVDQRKKTDDVLNMQAKISAQLSSLKEEQEREQCAAREERALQKRQALFRWLVPTNEDKHAKVSKPRVQGTGQWLIEHPCYFSWVRGMDPILWLRGIPGSGKTVLMSGIVDSLKKHPRVLQKSAGLLYFYCAFDNAETTGTLQILCSLAAQLIRCLSQPEHSSAMRLFESCDEGTRTPSLDQAQDLLIDLTGELQTVYICLDALNECNEDDKTNLLHIIEVLVSRCDNLSVVMSSHSDDREVGAYLDGRPNITLSSAGLKQDIDYYIRYRIDRGPQRLKRALSEQMIESLATSADGMFLWASCQVDQLSRLKTIPDIQNSLLSLPRGLYNMYDRILLEIPPEDQVFAARALRFFAHSIVPLSLEEVVEAIAVENNSSSLSDLQKLLDPEDLFHICGSLIRHFEPAGELGLAHHSVYKYLTTANTRSRALHPYYISSTQSAIILTRTCLTYLSFPDIGLTDVKASLQANLEANNPAEFQATERLPKGFFLDYALRNWWRHLPSTQEDLNQVWPSLKTFFDSETGAFGASLLALRYLEGDYKYPNCMQLVHFCATHGLSLLLSLLPRDTIDYDYEVEDGRRPLHMAAEIGHEEMVKVLLSHEADTNALTRDGRAPLQCAMECGNDAIIRLLVSHGADVNCNFSYGGTPLSLAVNNGWHWMIEFLLKKNANPKRVLANDVTILHVAAEAGSDSDVFQMLFNAGADRYARDKWLWTPLHYASYYGHAEAALILIGDFNTTRTIFERRGWTPLHIAVEHEHIRVLELFRDFVSTVSSLAVQRQGQHPISDDAFDADRSKPRARLQESRKTAERIPRAGISSAMAGISSPRAGISSSRAAISSSSSTKPVASFDEEYVPSPLWQATSQRFLLGIDFLLEAGTAPEDLGNCINFAFAKRNESALRHLVRHSISHVKELLKQVYKDDPANPEALETLKDLCDSPSWKADQLVDIMEHVIRQQDHELEVPQHDHQPLQLIIERFRQLVHNIESPDFGLLVGPLACAIECRDLKAVKLLRKAGDTIPPGTILRTLGKVKPHSVTCTFLHLAAHLQDLGMVLYLLENGQSPSAVDSLGRTPLHYAVQTHGTADAVAFLLSSGADVLAVDYQGWTPLHIAARYGSEGSIPFLLNAGASVHDRDNDEMTPLHHCAYSFSYVHDWPSHAMQTLIEAGASTRMTDREGLDPIVLTLFCAIQGRIPNLLSSVLTQYPELVRSNFPPKAATALHLAAEWDCDESILMILISRGALLEAIDRDGMTPMQVAGSVASRALIKLGARWI